MNKWLVVALAVAAGSADAGVHKCQAPDGKITYTDTGCPQGQDVNARERESTEGSQKGAASPGHADSGGGGFYRDQVRSAEKAAPKTEPAANARP